MEILIIIYTINWVYRLYEEYIVSFKNFIDKYYIDKYYNINITYYDSTINEDKQFINQIDINKYDKIFYSGDIDLYNIINSIYIDKKIYFINIEQLSHLSYYTYIRNITCNNNIIDYSEENIPYLNKLYNTFLIPPYFENIHINNIDKDIDILSIINNNYRKTIYDNIIIDNKYHKMEIDNCYNQTRDNIFNKTKIYINIHCSEKHQTMELIRLVNLITRKVIIISQKSMNNNLLFLNKFIIICNDNKDFSLYIEEVLKNYDSYYNKIYGNFEEDYNNYILYIKENIDKILG